MSMKWTSDGGDDDAKKEIDCAKENPTKQGYGIADKHLRCLAGTGDFRIGFFQSNKRVYGDTCEGMENNMEKQTCQSKERLNKDFDDYKGFQIRIHPHISRSFGEVIRLKEKENNNESHINLSLWTRLKKGNHGLMSDQCQGNDHCGFMKGWQWGSEPVPFGPNAPFGKSYDVSVVIERLSKTAYTTTVTVNGQTTKLQGTFNDGPKSTAYSRENIRAKFKSGEKVEGLEAFLPEQIDTVAITYTNSSRRYKYVDIEDLSVEYI